jgi:hypothetical protein
MDAKQFAVLFPTLYHLTFTSNLDSIKRHGLQSSARLADILLFDTEERDAALNRRRLCIQNIRGASLRDQHTANESKMKSCLVKITPEEWRTLLNAKVFFFLSIEKTLRFAEAYADYENTILETDTRALLGTHVANTSVCRIQSGSFVFRAVPRGRHSFIPLASFIHRSKRDTPAELTLDCPVPEILSISQVRSATSYRNEPR